MPVISSFINYPTAINVVLNFNGALAELNSLSSNSVILKDVDFVFAFRLFCKSFLFDLLNSLKQVEIQSMIHFGMLLPSLPHSGKPQDLYIMSSSVNRSGHISIAHRLFINISESTGLLYYTHDKIESELGFDYILYLNQGYTNEFGTNPFKPFIESTLTNIDNEINTSLKKNLPIFQNNIK